VSSTEISPVQAAGAHNICMTTPAGTSAAISGDVITHT
jgi:hypothetical protein